MAEITRKRVGELMRGVFSILVDNPEGLASRDLIAQLEEVTPPTDFELSEYPKRPGVRRFEKMVRFATIAPVKAGWLIKRRSGWVLTDAGRNAFVQYPDPEIFHAKVLELYRGWRALRTLQSQAELVEGLDENQGFGWGDYPLDSVFVRTEQRTVGEVVRRIRADRYDLSPDFQREFLWPIQKQSRLIESCLMRIPLPVFYVAEADDGKIIVVDGLQRLSTFRRFLDGDFKLQFHSRQEEVVEANPLEGKLYRDLQLNLQERIEDTQLTLYVLDAKAPERAKLDIFERVNSGEPLTRQQMRNCLYNGKATHWLKRAAESQIFLDATGKSLDRKKMRDREAINRFAAFRVIGLHEYRGDMDTYLAEALEEINAMPDDELTELDIAFNRSMAINLELFQQHAFRKSIAAPQGARSVLNIAFFDVCSVAFSRLSVELARHHSQQIKAAVTELLRDGNFVHAITYSTNATKQVSRRFEKIYDALGKAGL